VCGIAGFIGYSKNPNLTFRLITSLFEESQIRGIDASGYWGTETGDGSIVYHKEPIKASEFIKKQVWKDLHDVDLDMLLVHARGASAGVGAPSDNKNNHPFTSTCKSIGLVHNGRIPDNEYDLLTKQYEVFSKCDSEILLRIFEAGRGYNSEECNSVVDGEEIDNLTASRLMGLRDIWSFIDRGHMAVVIGERVDKSTRRLFLFRNRHRSLWLADVRKELGQVFFCSTPEIWNTAFKNSGVNKHFKNRIKMIELPTEELWTINISDNEPDIECIKKYDICASGRLMWKPQGDVIKITQNPPVASIVTKLNEKEEVLYASKKEYKNNLNIDNALEVPWDEQFPHVQDGIDTTHQVCSSIKSLVDNFRDIVEKKLSNGTMSENTLKELLHSMEMVELDMEGTIRLIDD
jgi:hypothetical protein